MTTYLDLQDSVLNTLHSQTLDQEERCALSADMTANALTFSVDDASQISRGLIEIDSELMWVKSADRSTNVVTVSPFGRGYGESTPATHSQNAMVVDSPRFPRQAVKTAIQETLSSVYPELFQVKVDETQTSSPVQGTYQVPADCAWIIGIDWQTIGPSGTWYPVRRYRLDPRADTTAYTTGRSVDIFEQMFPGRTIKITYAAAPGLLSADSDTLTGAGLGESVRDVIIFGACARLAQSIEAARLQSAAIEQSERAAFTPAGASTALSRSYWQLYQARLMAERDQLLKLHPHTAHMTR